MHAASEETQWQDKMKKMNRRQEVAARAAFRSFSAARTARIASAQSESDE